MHLLRAYSLLQCVIKKVHFRIRNIRKFIARKNTFFLMHSYIFMRCNDILAVLVHLLIRKNLKCRKSSSQVWMIEQKIHIKISSQEHRFHARGKTCSMTSVLSRHDYRSPINTVTSQPCLHSLGYNIYILLRTLVHMQCPWPLICVLSVGVKPICMTRC